MKRRTALILPLAASMFMALSPAIQAKKVTITYWEKWSGFEQKIIESIVNKFNASQNEVEVKYVLQPGAAFEKYLTACAAGHPPDLVGGWNHRLAPYVLNGVAEPLDAYLKGMGLSKKDFIPSYWDMMTYKGTVYGLPITCAAFATYWNKSMFAEAGLDPQTPPKTMDDLLYMNDKLTKKDANGKIKQIGYSPTLPGWYPYWWPVPFGADIYDETKDAIDFGQPGMVKSMKWIQAMSEKLGGSKGISGFSTDHSSKTGPFISGKMGIDLMGSWNPSYFLKLCPTIKYGIDDLPYGQGGQSWSWLEADVVFMPKANKNNKYTAKFLKYLMSPEVQRDFQLQREAFSAVRAANSPDFIKQNRNPGIADFLRIADNKQAGFTPKTTAWADLDSAIYGKLVSDVWSAKKSPEQALKDAQTAANVVIARKVKKNRK